MTHSPVDVLGIGNAIVDVISHAEDQFLLDNKIEKGAMTLIDANGASLLYEKMGPGKEMSGGSAANTIAGIASLGGEVSFIGKVADDQLGSVFGHDIRALGVHFETRPLKGSLPTARCLILVTPDAQRSMNTFLGACTQLTPDDVDEDAVKAASISYLEGYLFDPAPAREAFYKAAGIAHHAGRKVALTLSDAFCVDRYRYEFQHLIEEEVDILFANESEILSLYESSSFDDAVAAIRGKCETVAITRSEKGSVILGGEEMVEVPAYPVDSVVDTTGAGDQYAAGFLFGMSRNLAIETCGKLGSLAASEVISHVGARPDVSLKELASSHGLL